MNRVQPWTLSLIVTAAAMAAACAPAAMAASATSPAAHAHDASPAKNRLDHGRKWASDAPLREGMTRIRALVAPELPRAHAGTMAPAEYAALAAKVEVQVGYIVANCKLPPEADAVLHGVLSELSSGTAAMAGRAAGMQPSEGLLHVAQALNDHGRTFEHPGFKPIAIGH